MENLHVLSILGMTLARGTHWDPSEGSCWHYSGTLVVGGMKTLLANKLVRSES